MFRLDRPVRSYRKTIIDTAIGLRYTGEWEGETADSEEDPGAGLTSMTFRPLPEKDCVVPPATDSGWPSRLPGAVQESPHASPDPIGQNITKGSPVSLHGDEADSTD